MRARGTKHVRADACIRRPQHRATAAFAQPANGLWLAPACIEYHHELGLEVRRMLGVACMLDVLPVSRVHAGLYVVDQLLLGMAMRPAQYQHPIAAEQRVYITERHVG